MDLPIPQSVVYAGLAGSVLSLLVAAATNKWQLRVVLLLTLRLAIGWHFLFEGLHKIHSHLVGPTEYNRPFTSEPYFAAAEGPVGDYVRKKYLGDAEAQVAARVTPKDSFTPAEFAKMTRPEQARYCPEPVAAELEVAITDPKKLDIGTSSYTVTSTAASGVSAIAAERLEVAMAKYARWVYGVDARDSKVKFVSGDVPLSAPARRSIIAVLKKQVDELAARDAASLGHGYGIEQKRVQGAKADLRTAQADLAADSERFLVELIKEAGGTPADPPPKPLAKADKFTMWLITIVGACLIFGVLTPVACLVGTGFLLLTYLTHPPFPWYPLPPNTEGNPLFVNKNVIEMLALLVIAVHPTGRWLGLDALLVRLFTRSRTST